MMEVLLYGDFGYEILYIKSPIRSIYDTVGDNHMVIIEKSSLKSNSLIELSNDYLIIRYNQYDRLGNIIRSVIFNIVDFGENDLNYFFKFSKIKDVYFDRKESKKDLIDLDNYIKSYIRDYRLDDIFD
jgi:hypothetical protein